VTFIAKSVVAADQPLVDTKSGVARRFRQGRVALDPVFSLVFSQLSGTAVMAAVSPEAGV
jgi:hypothetical protein